VSECPKSRLGATHFWKLRVSGLALQQNKFNATTGVITVSLLFMTEFISMPAFAKSYKLKLKYNHPKLFAKKRMLLLKLAVSRII